jgi:DNA-binding CsgD family transcriptional regulator
MKGLGAARKLAGVQFPVSRDSPPEAGPDQDSLGRPQDSPMAAASAWAVEEVLSPRELEIVRLVAKGLANKTIGGVLDISPWTVASHIRRVFAKLGVSSRAAMIARVYEIGRPPGS